MTVSGERESPAARRAPTDGVLGAAALVCYAVHAGQHVWKGSAADALWACHVANLVLAASFVGSLRRGFGVGLMWLIVGNAMWVLYLVDGGAFQATSLLTHVGGLLIAIAGCLRYGIPPGAWGAATLGLIALQLLSRLVTSPDANVNVAWHAYGSWGDLIPSYPIYVTAIDLAAAALFWAIERGWRRWIRSSAASPKLAAGRQGPAAAGEREGGQRVN